MKAFWAQVFGIVQGVGFRYSALYEGRLLGLGGFVRNLPDGSVEVVAEGAEKNLEVFRTWLRHGPPGAIVREVNFRDLPYQGNYADFSIKY